MATLRFDEDAARKLRAAYTTPDVIAQRRATLERLALRPGESVLDAGCGPGYLSQAMAEAVGPEGRVVGIDLSEDLLSFAVSRNERDWLEYRFGDVTEPPVREGSFDVVVCIQVMEYVHAPDRALAAFHRALRPGGRVLVVDTDWDAVVWHSGDPARSARIMAAWEEHCADPRLPRSLAPRLRAAGFDRIAASGYPIVNLSFEEEDFSRSIAALVVSFLSGRGTVERAELDAWFADLETLNAEGRYYFSLLRTIFTARKQKD
jgi:SAM-dependent methyltransferase